MSQTQTTQSNKLTFKKQNTNLTNSSYKNMKHVSKIKSSDENCTNSSKPLWIKKHRS